MFNILFRKDATADKIKALHLQAGAQGTVDGVPAAVVKGLDGNLAIRLLDNTIVPAATARPADGRKFTHGRKGSQHTRPMQEG